jgi:DNA-binding GntR family transcriptional regulator
MMDTPTVTTVSEPALSAAERAYRHVKAEIMARRALPHDVISEGQVAAAVGVSRTPVREALLRLQSEGLLRLLPKRGALVLPVTTEQMLDLIETRRMIETFAVRKVISTGQVSVLGENLRRELDVMRAAMKDRDGASYVIADRAFHAEIVAAAGNSILIDVYRTLRDRQLRMGTVNLLDASGASADVARMRSTQADHERIATAIAARRLRVAEAAVNDHLDHAERLLAPRR